MGFQGGISEAVIEKMDGVNASVIGLAVVLVAWIFFKSRHGSSVQKLKLPPGPLPLSIIRNLHMLGKPPHRKLRELSKKYGPIMSLQEIAIMRESIMKLCGIKRSNPVNISKLVSTATMDIICRLAFGRKYSEEIQGNEFRRHFISPALPILGTFFRTWR
eukprot:Gb_06161 [translate_table: standard]